MESKKNKIVIECEKIGIGRIHYKTEVDGQFDYTDIMRVSMNLSLIASNIIDSLLTQMLKDKPNDSTLKARYESNKQYLESIELILKLDSKLEKGFMASK
jgi:hypothetical protein